MKLIVEVRSYLATITVIQKGLSTRLKSFQLASAGHTHAIYRGGYAHKTAKQLFNHQANTTISSQDEYQPS
jgi:hypothetical protein